MDTILFATDGSPSARAAQEEALTLAKATGWRVRVVTVWRIPILTGYGFAPTPYVPELRFCPGKRVIHSTMHRI